MSNWYRIANISSERQIHYRTAREYKMLLLVVQQSGWQSILLSRPLYNKRSEILRPFIQSYPYTNTNINELEKTQWRAARSAMRNNSRGSRIILMMKILKWEFLEWRREVSRHGETAKSPRSFSKQVLPTTQVYGDSSFNRTLKEWNRLIETLVSANTFKCCLSSRFKFPNMVWQIPPFSY